MSWKSDQRFAPSRFRSTPAPVRQPTTRGGASASAKAFREGEQKISIVMLCTRCGSRWLGRNNPHS